MGGCGDMSLMRDISVLNPWQIHLQTRAHSRASAAQSHMFEQWLNWTNMNRNPVAEFSINVGMCFFLSAGGFTIAPRATEKKPAKPIQLCSVTSSQSATRAAQSHPYSRRLARVAGR